MVFFKKLEILSTSLNLIHINADLANERTTVFNTKNNICRNIKYSKHVFKFLLMFEMCRRRYSVPYFSVGYTSFDCRIKISNYFR